MKVFKVFLCLIVVCTSCHNEDEFQRKYIDLLELRLLELRETKIQNQQVDSLFDEEVSVEQAMKDAEDFYIFLCGNSARLLDIRVRKTLVNKWYIIYTVKGSKFDEFGFETERNIAFSVFSKNNKLQFSEVTLNRDLCE